MALSYSLKYKKLNFFYKALLEKEGEVIIDRQFFRLKGKGARDQGETIYFSDIKELSLGEDQMKFTTFKKERFILNGFSNLFESFLKDFFRVRNEYLAEVLLMKMGMLYHEYEGQVEIVNRFGKFINRGKSRIQFYEGSILIIPENHDCFAIYLNFLKSHEFDEDEYVLKLHLDSGSVVQISKLGTEFSDVQETLESLLGKMYEKIMNHLQEVLPGLDPMTLLKFASIIRDGKLVLFSSLKKIHEELPSKIDTLLFQESAPSLREKIQMLRSMSSSSDFHVSFTLSNRPDGKELVMKSWIVVTFPEFNTVAFAQTSKSNTDESFYFFQIGIEGEDMSEKLIDKIQEINQSLFLSRFDFGIMYKDKRELKKTKYRTALRKLIFLRLLRRSFLGRVSTQDLASFKNECTKTFSRAKFTPKPFLKPKN